MPKTIVVSKLPSAGLGNKLFPWAAGVVYSKLFNCQHKICGLTKLHVGPFLRKETSKRFYFAYFINEFFFDARYHLRLGKHCMLAQKNADQHQQGCDCIIFSEIPHWKDHFITLKKYRNLIIHQFWQDLNLHIKKKVESHKTPSISVHIRMGDFKPLKPHENLLKKGNARTPISYFKDAISFIRANSGYKGPITVFSDGYDHELQEILSMDKVYKAKDDLDIVHLVLMSKSKAIIMSHGSTFSYWAGFLSNATILLPYISLKNPIRDEETNKTFYEGAFNPDTNDHDPLLLENLKKIS